MKKKKGFLTERFLRPDVDGFRANEESEHGVYGKHYCNIRPLLMGALAILEKGSEECGSCGNASELLEAFLDGMNAAEDVVNRAVCVDTPIITIDELKKKLGKVGRANIAVWVNAEGILQREMFRIQGEGKTIMEIAEEKRNGGKKQKSGKAA